MKISIIRCQENSNQCVGYHCFPALQNMTGEYLKRYDSIELVGYDTCGGCGRNKAVKILAKALRLKEHGAEVIHLGNCLVSVCPFKDLYEKELKKKCEYPL